MDTNKRQGYTRKYNQSAKGRKSQKINYWRRQGLIGDYDFIYDKWLNTTHCELCNCDFNTNKKCMEHCHDTGRFRNIVCASCNSNKSDKKKPITNKSGYKHISLQNNTWVYKKTFKGKRYNKCDTDKIKILCIKFAYIILLRY